MNNRLVFEFDNQCQTNAHLTFSGSNNRLLIIDFNNRCHRTGPRMTRLSGQPDFLCLLDQQMKVSWKLPQMHTPSFYPCNLITRKTIVISRMPSLLDIVQLDQPRQLCTFACIVHGRHPGNLISNPMSFSRFRT